MSVVRSVDDAANAGVRRKPAGRYRAIPVLRAGLSLMTRAEIRNSILIGILMIVVGLIEGVVIAAVMPLVWLIVEPSALFQNEIAAGALDFLGQPEEKTLVLVLAGAVIGLILVGAGLKLAAQYAIHRHSASCKDRLGRELMEKCVTAPYVWLAARNSAVLTRQFYSDLEHWRVDFIQSQMIIVQAAVLIVFPSVVVLTMAPIFGLVALVVVGLFATTAALISRPRIVALAAEQKKVGDNLMKDAVQTFQGVKDIKVSAREPFFIDQFDRVNRRTNHLMLLRRMWQLVPSAAISMFGQAGFLSIAVVLWMNDIGGGEIAAQMAMFAVVASRVVPSANRLVGQTGAFFGSLPFVEALLNLIKQIDEAQKHFGRQRTGDKVPEDWREVRLEGVGLKYPGAREPSLRGVTAVLERGKSYGFVGRSGAGKSTLIDIVLGLLEPEHGQIMIDGQSLHTLDLTSWHKQIGVVPQNLFIADDTLVANVAFGVDPAKVDGKRVARALTGAHLDDLLNTLENGLDTRIGESGSRLSGGQIQRVGVARALYNTPQILILDEATSALDGVSERAVEMAIADMSGKITTLAITHRVTTLLTFDHIFVLDDGVVVAEGDYAKLLRESPMFRQLVARGAIGTSQIDRVPDEMSSEP